MSSQSAGVLPSALDANGTVTMAFQASYAAPSSAASSASEGGRHVGTADRSSSSGRSATFANTTTQLWPYARAQLGQVV